MATARKTISLILLAMPLLISASAEAQDSALCAFVKRVLVDRPSEFSNLKGPRDESTGSQTIFKGTAVPDGTTKCNLYVRRKSGSRILEPVYWCTKYGLGIQDAKALYTQYANELRSCFAGATITEELPRASHRTLTWKWMARTTEYAAELEVSDAEYIMQSLAERKPLEQKMTVSVKVLDLSPPRPGAILPDVR
jgi:hypothetical protein